MIPPRVGIGIVGDMSEGMMLGEHLEELMLLGIGYPSEDIRTQQCAFNSSLEPGSTVGCVLPVIYVRETNEDINPPALRRADPGFGGNLAGKLDFEWNRGDRLYRLYRVYVCE